MPHTNGNVWISSNLRQMKVDLRTFFGGVGKYDYLSQ